jgi:hypothetical protein
LTHSPAALPAWTTYLDPAQRYGVGPGIEISRAFFHEHVEPLADARLGRSAYAAALLGMGSEVLGLDTEMSTDHDWGPRVVLLVEPEARTAADAIGDELPASYRGFSRTFGSLAGGAPWTHPFEVSTVSDYFHAWIGFHDRSSATLLDWLSRPAMSFLAVTAGAVFHDGSGALTSARTAAHWYPDDVWRWLVACQWDHISQEHPFVGRARTVGDRLGGLVLAGRVARDAMRLAFLLERRYAPYGKWLGPAFTRLTVGPVIGPMLADALGGDDAPCEDRLNAALESLGDHTKTQLGIGVETARRQFHTRPFDVVPSGEIAQALLATISDERLLALPLVGNVDLLYGTNNGGTPGACTVYQALLNPPEPGHERRPSTARRGSREAQH